MCVNDDYLIRRLPIIDVISVDPDSPVTFNSVDSMIITSQCDLGLIGSIFYFFFFCWRGKVKVFVRFSFGRVVCRWVTHLSGARFLCRLDAAVRSFVRS